VSRAASAPGRVNLLGEHVDHAGGTVLPVAVNLRVFVDYAPGDAWAIASEGHTDGGPWTRYVEGVIAVLDEAGLVSQPGEVAIRSKLPERKGLASSAALEVAVAGAICDAPPLELARLCRRAENEGVGVPCGFMDQAVAACAIAGHALALDCSSETFFHLPLPEFELIVFDSGFDRGLGETPYAERLEEARTPGTDAARHVEGEKARVERGIEALDAKDVPSFGRLLNESHASLRDLYRCSLPEIDALVERLWATPGVFGARLVGAGWGGMVLAVAEPGTRLQGGTNLVSDDGLSRIE